jgi:hypothetical protein
MGSQYTEKVPCRLICLRVSEEIANERRRRLRKELLQNGYNPSRFRLELCVWTLIVTNIPEEWLSPEMARALYTLRWQIELLFKQLKSVLRVHESNTSNQHRLRSELYGKLIMAVLIHHIHSRLNVLLWNREHREVSMDKLYKRIAERAFPLLSRFLLSIKKAARYLHDEISQFLFHCQKELYPTRLTTLGMLEAGYDQRLEKYKLPCLT